MPASFHCIWDRLSFTSAPLPAIWFRRCRRHRIVRQRDAIGKGLRWRWLCTGGPALGGRFALWKEGLPQREKLRVWPNDRLLWQGRLVSAPGQGERQEAKQHCQSRPRYSSPCGPSSASSPKKPGGAPSCSLGLRSFPLHRPFLFAAHSANLRSPREGRNDAPDCHTNNRRDCVRRGPRCPARLPIRGQPGYVKLYPPRDTRSSHPDSGRNALSGASDGTRALSGASASRAAAIE